MLHGKRVTKNAEALRGRQELKNKKVISNGIQWSLEDCKDGEKLRTDALQVGPHHKNRDKRNNCRCEEKQPRNLWKESDTVNSGGQQAFLFLLRDFF